MTEFRSWDDVLAWVIAAQQAHPRPDFGEVNVRLLNQAVRANGMTVEQIAAVNAAAARRHGPHETTHDPK